MVRNTGAATWVAALGLATAGCATYARNCLRLDPPQAPVAGQVQVTFLGVGGVLLRYQAGGRSVALMTAPFYSSPTVGEIATQPVASDQRRIDALLRRWLPADPSDVLGILAGHSHYDHLMDVPYVALEMTPAARVYGNDAMTRLLHPLRPRLGSGRLVSLEPKGRALEKCRCCENCPQGLPKVYEDLGDLIRVWPILSEHSSQFQIKAPLVPKALLPPVHLWRGDLLEPRSELPTRPGEWVEGTTLAYLIDFLEEPGGTVAFRVYYQDSAAREPYGFPPPCLLRDRRVDLAILCVGGSETVRHNPTAILRALRPTYVLGAHWEDFFNPRALPLPATMCTPRDVCCERISGLPHGKPEAFMKRVKASLTALDGGYYSLPCPDTATTFSRDAGSPGWNIVAAKTTAGWRMATPRR